MRFKLPRALARVVVVVALVVAADQVTPWWVEKYFAEELPLPPFARLTEPQREAYAAQLVKIREGSPPSPVNGFDEELGWTNRPGQRRGIKINALGARSAREYTPQPPENVLRIACFGTSFVFGAEVHTSETWSVKLEDEHANLEVINLGVGGYGTDQALLRMRREGLMGADVALMGLCLENIGRNVNRYRANYTPSTKAIASKPRFLLTENGELTLLPQPYASRAELLEAALHDRVDGDCAQDEFWRFAPVLSWSGTARVIAGLRARTARARAHDLWSQPDSEPFRITLALLDAFRTEALALGASDARVLIFGRAHDLELARVAGGPYWTDLVAELERREIAYIDVAAEMLQLERDDLFRTEHPSPAGNDVIARVLTRELIEPWNTELHAKAKR